MTEERMIAAFEVEALEGKSDEEIDEIAGALADEIADAMAAEGEEVATSDEIEEE